MRKITYSQSLHSRAAFQRIELLTVISVLILLFGVILLPGVDQTASQAHRSSCLRNLKQLTAAWQLYANDNGGKLVPVVYLVNGKINSNAWVWGSMDDDTRTYPNVDPARLDSTNAAGLKQGSLYKYVGATDAFRCPADASTINKVPRVRSYSANGWFGGVAVSGKNQTNLTVLSNLTDITSPANGWVFIDEHARSINDGWFAMDVEGSRGLLDAPTKRHDNGFSLSFADGSADIWKLTDARTLNWQTLPISNDPPNSDWKQLSARTLGRAQASPTGE